MGDEILFLSDCHLDARRPETGKALLDFLETRTADAAKLYILGDLFEVWVGDDDPAEAHRPVIEALNALAKRCDVFFIAGNRDFLLGEAFASRSGMTLLSEPEILQLGEKRVALMHGDTLCTDDHDYQAFRTMVRDPEWIAATLARPLEERQQLAARLRDDSASAMSEKSSEIMDVNEAAVVEAFSDSGADVIVHGHTHRPAIHDYPSGKKRIVLGDWHAEPSYLRWRADSGFTLTDPRISAQTA